MKNPEGTDFQNVLVFFGSQCMCLAFITADLKHSSPL